VSKQLLLPAPLVVTFLAWTALGQNLDLTPESWSGRNRGLGGAGSALAQGASALNVNPAGLGSLDAIAFSTGHEAEYHCYSLLRENVGDWGFVNDWSATRFAPEYVTAVVPIREHLGVGVGYGTSILPFVDNDRLAITGSSLFHQRTDGSVNALSIAGGFRIAGGLQAGAMLCRYSGTVTSSLQGDNHGRDVDKWARLKSSVEGWGAQWGLLLSWSVFSVAGRVTLPNSLTITTTKSISPDRSYESLFPPYDETTWKLPLIVTVGAECSPDSLWTLVGDVEFRKYSSSDVQWNMYEAGGMPTWKDVVVLRVGTEFHPFSPVTLPVRVGYAYIPQIYESIDAQGTAYQVTSYTNTGRNTKHFFTAGTSCSFSNIDLAVSLEYSILTWHRDLHDVTTVLDDYTEKRLGLFLEVDYRLE
jgi:hypothetical protein